MTKDNICVLCGAKLLQHGKIKKEFSTKNFGTEEKPILKPICNDCKGRFETK